MPMILDSLFHKVINTTSIPIGVEGGGWWGATKWRELPIQKPLWPNGFNSGHFQLHMSQNVATVDRCPVSPASLVVIPCQLSAWPGKLEPFTEHPSIDGCQTGP